MGDETTQFAPRFTEAVTFLAALAGGSTAPPERGAGDVARALRHALDAVEAVYATETGAMRDWPERRRRVLARLGSVREALAAWGLGGEARRRVQALVRLLDPDGGPDAAER